jgi:hypothetical protein
MFWVFCAFLGTVILLCAWMLLAPGQGAETPALPAGYLPGGYRPGGHGSGGDPPAGPWVSITSEASAVAAQQAPGGSIDAGSS